ncbi:uncharacterized protein LOC102789195, partial [Neolamprologus brichardi]|uniref:uncharacterized protein LOC102789195 n=1 Tax=Neolamprologus brichardi TaxID=32507 RepID=UPI001643B79A
MDFCKQPNERSTACNSSAGRLFISIPKEHHSSFTDSHLPGFQRGSASFALNLQLNSQRTQTPLLVPCCGPMFRGIVFLQIKLLLFFFSYCVSSVSQLALALVVEVNEGEGSVQLPCQYSGFIPEYNPTVLWTRDDLDPKSVHIRREGGDDLRGQNQLYSRRTSLKPDALDSSDFSLTLRKPTKTDSGNYTCSISDGREEQRLKNIQLQVKDQQVEVGVEEGSESVLLPCKTKPDLPEDTRVEWNRSDRELMMVHVYPNRTNLLKKQDNLYRDRTKMNKDLLRTGDLSLTLKYPTDWDTGGYICTIYRDGDILRQKVVLQVKEQFPSWTIVLLVLLVLLVVLVVSGSLFLVYGDYFMSVYKVEVDSGVESVQLICKTTVCLPKDAKVEWKVCQVEVEEGAESVQLPLKTTQNLSEDAEVLWWHYDPVLLVHVYKNGSDQPHKQHQVYRDRTKMNEDLLKTGDLSLTL